MTLQQRVGQVWLLLMVVGVVGTLGYVVIEGWSLFDGLYMTVITLATIGYGEVYPLSMAGRAFTMVLIVAGVGVVAYGFSTMTALWVEGTVSDVWERRRMERQICALKNHVIVCGGGQTGRHIAEELTKAEMPFVVIELDDGRLQTLRKRDPTILTIAGDATDVEVLKHAGVEQAFGLAACMPADKDNLFTLLTARDLNPNMRIVTRVIADDANARLQKVGADAVVSTSRIGALRIASEMLRPHVVSVLDAMLREPSPIRVQEVRVGVGGAGKTLGALDMQARTGTIVFAMRAAGDRHHIFNPPPDRVLVEDDILILCADPVQVEHARQVAESG
ncbi:MAG: potassium channel protein [Chloroflexi bacterium]|nr:potassium channel protein [Chloroflexota bacterium]